MFSDDDLKWLKEEFEYASSNRMVVGSYKIETNKYKALLVRLEAAEHCIPYHECQDDLSTCPHLEAWRKTAGK